MTKQPRILTAAEAGMLSDLQKRINAQADDIVTIAKETGGKASRSIRYLNLDTISHAIGNILDCDEGTYTHDVPAENGG